MFGVNPRSTKFGFAKFGLNSWGVGASVTIGMYFKSDGNLQFDPAIVNDEAFGQTFLGTTETGDVKAPEITLEQQARYDDKSYLLQALAMGSPAAVTISTSAAGQVTSWLHTIDLAAVIDGLGGTFATDKVLFVEELTSAKIHGFTLKNGTGGVMDMAFKVMGSKPTIQSSININSTLAGITFPALGNRLFKKHGTFRMNLNTAGALGAADAVKAEAIDFTFDRPQDTPQPFGQDYIDEPSDNNFPVLQISVTYPRMNTPSANSLYAGLRDATAFKADLTFLGQFINSTDQYKQLYQWPSLQLSNYEDQLIGGQQVRPKATFMAKLAATSPTGMAFVNPFRLTRVMTQSVVAF